jgi:hypothetical protein
MEAKGEVYRVMPATLLARSTQDEAADLDQRRTQGYGLSGPSTDGSSDGTADNDLYVRGLSVDEQARYLDALFGDRAKTGSIDLPGGGQVSFPLDGCVAESRISLYRDLTEWARLFHIPQALDAQLAVRVPLEARYKAVMAEWSRCMDTKGFHYGLPSDGVADLAKTYREDGPSPSLREREIAVAVSDSLCSQSVGVSAVVEVIKREYFDGFSEATKSMLATLARLRTAAIARAASVSLHG